MTAERVLDPQAVDAAEFARKNNQVAIAAGMAAIGLGLTSSPLTFEEVATMAQNPDQRAILACLGRIYVDSLKTLANQTWLPSKALPPLEVATTTLNIVHRHPDLDLAIREVDKDHLGRQHYFWPEMKRDEAKTFFAASVLYGAQTADHLVLQGERLLEQTYRTLPDGHPTKPLIGIEIELSRASRGQKPDTKALVRNFRILTNSDKSTNPHRVATVASWLIVWGERLKNKDIEAEASWVFQDLIEAHPEWAFMTQSERNKIARQKLRKIFFRLATPLTTWAPRLGQLYSDLLH